MTGRSATTTQSRGLSPGRPRDTRADQAIMEATRQLLATVGYARLSFEAVARAAHVTRPTIYRRWPSKAHLVHEAAFPHADGPLLSDTGCFADDLRELVRRIYDFYTRPAVLAASAGLLVEFQQNPALRDELGQRVGTAARAQLGASVERALASGEVRTGTDAGVLFDAAVGAVLFRLLVVGAGHPTFADEVADTLIHGICGPALNAHMGDSPAGVVDA